LSSIAYRLSRFRIALFFALLLCFAASAAPLPDRNFDELTLAVDTNLYRFSQHTIMLQRKHCLSFAYSERNAVCELRLYPKDGSPVQGVELVESGGYTLLDSLAYMEDDRCYRGRVRFADLFSNAQLSLLFKLRVAQDDGSLRDKLWEVPLFPYTQTWAKIFTATDMLFVGEEKSFEIESNHADNIKVSGEWQTSNGIDYRLTYRDGKLMLALLPRELGVRQLEAALETLSPYMDDNKKLRNDIALSSPAFTIKASRLAFLSMDRKEITYDEGTRSKGVSVTIDNHRQLQVGKTYRIEDQETPGGSLIAELFTLKGLANDKVLCKLTAFNLHRNTEGYLYIKNGDVPVFITNLDITPQMHITSIYLLHEGEDWKPSVRVHPGERVDVAIVGESLHKAHFSWQDVENITSDSVGQTEFRQQFKLIVPMNINKKEIVLLNNGQPSGKVLVVDEYQRPRPFDYITLRYGYNSRVKVNAVSSTIISRNVVRDFSIMFNKDEIDSRIKLYGKQYVDIDVRVIGRKGEIIEIRSLKNQLICPDEPSPRAAFYNDKADLNESININNLLGTKTSSLDNFGRVQLEIKNSEGKYSEPAFEKRIEVVYQPRVIFDIDLSLPGGMMIQNLGKSQSEIAAMDNYNTAYSDWVSAGSDPATRPKKPSKPSFTDNLGGISIALIAQLRFTDDVKPGKEKFYRVGAGFLFLNTFNFQESAQRDLAVVVLGSIYPLSSRRMWNVPIHVGVGYKIQDKIPFLMISPGISVSF
jgi:hypothetical protein